MLHDVHTIILNSSLKAEVLRLKIQSNIYQDHVIPVRTASLPFGFHGVYDLSYSHANCQK